MGKPRMTLLAIAIKAAEPLSDEEKQTLRDILRPAPKPRHKGKGSMRRSSKPLSPSASVTRSIDENQLAQKRKAGKEAAVTTDNDNPGFCAYGGCQLFPDDNIHHKQTMPGYHEFVEPVGEVKGASANG